MNKVKWYFPLIGVGYSGKTWTINEFDRLCLEKYRNKTTKIKKTSNKRRSVEFIVNNRIVKAYLVPSSYQEAQITLSNRERMWNGIKESISKDIQKAIEKNCDIIIAAFNPKNDFIIDSVNFVKQKSHKVVPIHLRRSDGRNISDLDSVFETIRNKFRDSRIIKSRKTKETDQAEKLEFIIQRYCRHDIA